MTMLEAKPYPHPSASADISLDALVTVAATLLLAAAVELPIALFVTRRKVRQDIQAARDELFTKLEELRPPGAMKGGMDPRDMRALREEKSLEHARTEATILSALAERFGEFKAKAAWNFVPSHIKKAAIKAGDDWLFVLEPVLDAVAKRVVEDDPTATGSWNTSR